MIWVGVLNVLYTNMECIVSAFSIVNGCIWEISKINLLEACSSRRNKKRDENAAIPDQGRRTRCVLLGDCILWWKSWIGHRSHAVKEQHLTGKSSK